MRLMLLTLLLVVGCSSCFRDHRQEARDVVIRELSARYARSFTVEHVHEIAWTDRIEMEIIARANADGSGPLLRGSAHTTLNGDDVRVIANESFGTLLASRIVSDEVAQKFKSAIRSAQLPPLPLRVCVLGVITNVTSPDSIRDDLHAEHNSLRLRVVEPATDAAGDLDARLSAVYSIVTNLEDSVRPGDVEWHFLNGPIPPELEDEICLPTPNGGTPLSNLLLEATQVSFSVLPHYFSDYRNSKEAFLEHARVRPGIR